MGHDAIDLTPRETTAWQVGWSVGFVALVLSPFAAVWLHHWWPVAAAFGLFVALLLGHPIYLARTRLRSVASVLAESELLPDRRRSGRMALVMVPLTVASFTAGVVGGHEPYRIGSALLLGVLGVWCGARLVAPFSESVLVRQGRYPVDGFYLFACGLLILDGVIDLLRGETIAEWSAGVWSLPLGLLMVISEIRRWRVWNTLPDGIDSSSQRDATSAAER